MDSIYHKRVYPHIYQIHMAYLFCRIIHIRGQLYHLHAGPLLWKRSTTRHSLLLFRQRAELSDDMEEGSSLW